MKYIIQWFRNLLAILFIIFVCIPWTILNVASFVITLGIFVPSESIKWSALEILKDVSGL